MPIVGKSITDVGIKIDPKNRERVSGIQNNMLIRDVKLEEINKKPLLLLKCNLVTTYLKQDKKPIAQFMISQDMLYASNDKEVKKVIKEWKDKNKLPKKFEDSIIEGVNTMCMYDMQFFTNRMGFPPPTGFNFKIDKKSGKKKKKKKGKKK